MEGVWYFKIKVLRRAISLNITVMLQRGHCFALSAFNTLGVLCQVHLIVLIILEHARDIREEKIH